MQVFDHFFSKNGIYTEGSPPTQKSPTTKVIGLFVMSVRRDESRLYPVLSVNLNITRQRFAAT
jgi:hypothetical protein